MENNIWIRYTYLYIMEKLEEGEILESPKTPQLEPNSTQTK